mmetsp:Transcript_15028/g.17590  ORF Transcript_15028/g.17590 Transcript_15028/m.17590 type:complete len:121 (+) Transcript_15028:39-401(+)
MYYVCIQNAHFNYLKIYACSIKTCIIYIYKMCISFALQNIYLHIYSIETEDTMSVWKIAHTIKGTALQCGLDRLAFASENLERAFRQPEGDDMTKRSLYYQTFVNESERVIGTARKLGAQ